MCIVSHFVGGLSLHMSRCFSVALSVHLALALFLLTVERQSRQKEGLENNTVHSGGGVLHLEILSVTAGERDRGGRNRSRADSESIYLFARMRVCRFISFCSSSSVHFLQIACMTESAESALPPEDLLHALSFQIRVWFQKLISLYPSRCTRFQIRAPLSSSLSENLIFFISEQARPTSLVPFFFRSFFCDKKVRHTCMCRGAELSSSYFFYDCRVGVCQACVAA
mmetsp:Transcript_18957/g.38300  ORF Transcript_18957/g.38300 Transcript_18957/m.38300 type:complete len:225 (+) Transcript_18957:137-811(+)